MLAIPLPIRPLAVDPALEEDFVFEGEDGFFEGEEGTFEGDLEVLLFL